jgi:transposase-like protein
MDVGTFRAWLSGMDNLTADQREEVQAILHGREPGAEVTAAIEDRLTAERCCPHCGTRGAVKRGSANGLRRYRCKACSKSFNALTGTPLARLRHKARWFDFAQALTDGDTVRASAGRCAVAVGTAFRWRHRFLQALKTGTAPLRGIVEADETFVLDSRKGDRHLDRPARKRGGKATKRGLSRQQVPILVAADRSGTTLSAVLPGVSALTIQAVLEPAIDKDALLVTDGAAVSPRCAADLGISHEALNQSAGERVRGELHIQTVNNRHQRLKAFLAPFHGIATKYLPNYLRWFLSVALAAHPSSRACLNAALGLQPTVAVPS